VKLVDMNEKYTDNRFAALLSPQMASNIATSGEVSHNKRVIRWRWLIWTTTSSLSRCYTSCWTEAQSPMR